MQRQLQCAVVCYSDTATHCNTLHREYLATQGQVPFGAVAVTLAVAVAHILYRVAVSLVKSDQTSHVRLETQRERRGGRAEGGKEGGRERWGE